MNDICLFTSDTGTNLIIKTAGNVNVILIVDIVSRKTKTCQIVKLMAFCLSRY